MAPRLSPSQKQLLSLYRRGLRGIRRKPEVGPEHCVAWVVMVSRGAAAP